MAAPGFRPAPYVFSSSWRPKQKAILGRPLHRIAERDRRPGFGRGPLQGQGPEVAAIIATRTALRVAPLNFETRGRRGAQKKSPPSWS